MAQQILMADEHYKELDKYLKDSGHRTILLVCGNSLSRLRINDYFDSLEDRLSIRVVKFSGFQPNPSYESVVEGVRLFCHEGCDAIIAVGGGSAMDVAKCIKLYCNMDHAVSYLKQKITPNDVDFLAVPTTAGTGSEATRYAVIYHNGEKQSVDDESGIPAAVLFDASALETLPEYQKKVTMMDALCHAIEAYWSVNSNEESQAYSKAAIQAILANKQAYLNNDKIGNANMLRAANLAGKAINITQTTAGHAMCYKLTSLYGIPHGHAVALCVAGLFPYMIDHLEQCIDPRGEAYLAEIFEQIAKAMNCANARAAANSFRELVKELALEKPVASGRDYEVLKTSVNSDRLRNHPIKLEPETIDSLYHKIIQG